MEFMIHPLTGEEGYFTNKKEKELINAIFEKYLSSHDVRGVSNE